MRYIVWLYLLWGGGSLAEVRPVDINKPSQGDGLGWAYGERETYYEFKLSGYTGAGEDGFFKDISRSIIHSQLWVSSPAGSNEMEFRWNAFWFQRDGSLTPESEGYDPSLSTFRLGNPFIGYYWTWRSLSYQFRLGLGGSAPVATIRKSKGEDEELLDQEAFQAAAGIFAYRDLWLYAANRGSLLNHIDFFRRHSSGLTWGGRGILGHLLNIGDGDLYELWGQFDVELGWEFSAVQVVLRGSHTQYFLHNFPSELDTTQESAGLDLRIRTGSFDLILSGTFPLDEPYGPPGGAGKFWGASVALASPTLLKLPLVED